MARPELLRPKTLALLRLLKLPVQSLDQGGVHVLQSPQRLIQLRDARLSLQQLDLQRCQFLFQLRLLRIEARIRGGELFLPCQKLESESFVLLLQLGRQLPVGGKQLVEPHGLFFQCGYFDLELAVGLPGLRVAVHQPLLREGGPGLCFFGPEFELELGLLFLHGSQLPPEVLVLVVSLLLIDDEPGQLLPDPLADGGGLGLEGVADDVDVVFDGGLGLEQLLVEGGRLLDLAELLLVECHVQHLDGETVQLLGDALGLGHDALLAVLGLDQLPRLELEGALLAVEVQDLHQLQQLLRKLLPALVEDRTLQQGHRRLRPALLVLDQSRLPLVKGHVLPQRGLQHADVSPQVLGPGQLGEDGLSLILVPRDVLVCGGGEGLPEAPQLLEGDEADGVVPVDVAPAAETGQLEGAGTVGVEAEVDGLVVPGLLEAVVGGADEQLLVVLALPLHLNQSIDRQKSLRLQSRSSRDCGCDLPPTIFLAMLASPWCTLASQSRDSPWRQRPHSWLFGRCSSSIAANCPLSDFMYCSFSSRSSFSSSSSSSICLTLLTFSCQSASTPPLSRLTVCLHSCSLCACSASFWVRVMCSCWLSALNLATVSLALLNSASSRSHCSCSCLTRASLSSLPSSAYARSAFSLENSSLSSCSRSSSLSNYFSEHSSLPSSLLSSLNSLSRGIVSDRAVSSFASSEQSWPARAASISASIPSTNQQYYSPLIPPNLALKLDRQKSFCCMSHRCRFWLLQFMLRQLASYSVFSQSSALVTLSCSCNYSTSSPRVSLTQLTSSFSSTPRPSSSSFCLWIVSLASSSSSMSSLTLRSSLTMGLFFMRLARSPNRRVLRVSRSLKLQIEQLITSVVLELPPRESCSTLVSLESRQGMCSVLSAVRALMTMPSTVSDLFMFLAQSSCCPVTPVLPTFSEPARSTKLSFEVLHFERRRSRDSTTTVNREWLLELFSFMPVKATLRLLAPTCISRMTSRKEATDTSVRPCTNTPRALSSLSSSRTLVESSRSMIFSLQISMQEHRSTNSMPSPSLRISANRASIVRGIRPLNFSSEWLGPSIVQVLPPPVCPQAITVPLKPLKTASRIGLPTLAKTSPCSASGGKTWSKAKSWRQVARASARTMESELSRKVTHWRPWFLIST